LKTWGLIVLGAATALLLISGQALPPIGSLDSPISQRLDSYFIANAIPDTATPNIVSAILADYRSYDTLGETTVVFAAGLSCYLLLRRQL
jgi:multicomponent Na+:H+ antiporter subunit B